MNSVEKSAKTVKEAIRLCLEELHCDSADVDIEVLEMGSPGIFGMFGKPAKVRLTRKHVDRDFEIEMPTLSLDSTPARKPKAEKPQKKKEVKEPKETKEPKEVKEVKEETQESAEQAADKSAEKPAQSKSRSRNRSRKEKQPAAQNAEKPAEAQEAPAAPVEEEPFVATPEDQLSETAIKARNFISELTEKMGAPVTMEIQETPEQLRVKMAGENISMLIGRRGETLDSVQYLTSLCVNRGRDEYLRVSLDTENYRAKREEALRKLAVRMANRARKTGKRVSLEPMNPYERRILHSALQNDPDVTTHSEGEEPYRRVIITLK